MLSVTSSYCYAKRRQAECHYVECHNAECHCAERRNAECHCAERHNAECHCAECRNAECHCAAECRNAECHCAECRYAECLGDLIANSVTQDMPMYSSSLNTHNLNAYRQISNLRPHFASRCMQ